MFRDTCGWRAPKYNWHPAPQSQSFSCSLLERFSEIQTHGKDKEPWHMHTASHLTPHNPDLLISLMRSKTRDGFPNILRWMGHRHDAILIPRFQTSFIVTLIDVAPTTSSSIPGMDTDCGYRECYRECGHYLRNL